MDETDVAAAAAAENDEIDAVDSSMLVGKPMLQQMLLEGNDHDCFGGGDEVVPSLAVGVDSLRNRHDVNDDDVVVVVAAHVVMDNVGTVVDDAAVIVVEMDADAAAVARDDDAPHNDDVEQHLQALPQHQQHKQHQHQQQFVHDEEAAWASMGDDNGLDSSCTTRRHLHPQHQQNLPSSHVCLPKRKMAGCERHLFYHHEYRQLMMKHWLQK